MRMRTSRLSPRAGTNMVKDVRLDINFDNIYGVYYSGNNVKGDVILDIHQASKLKAIKIRFRDIHGDSHSLLNLLDLNADPSASLGCEAENEKFVCCFCCRSGPISATLGVRKSGYVPGESITLGTTITNHSNRNISSAILEFQMVVIYHARGRRKTYQKRIASCNRGQIKPGESDDWSPNDLVVPSLPPSYLKLSVHIAGPAFQMRVPVDIIIGSIPLLSTVKEYGPPPPLCEVHPDMSPSPILGLPASIPDPSFAEGILKLKDEEDDFSDEHFRGRSHYTPVYTYYNWNPPKSDTIQMDNETSMFSQ
ncbi:hypothetical protein ScPMuIL_018372 [Solemya velum]